MLKGHAYASSPMPAPLQLPELNCSLLNVGLHKHATETVMGEITCKLLKVLLSGPCFVVYHAHPHRHPPDALHKYKRSGHTHYGHPAQRVPINQCLACQSCCYTTRSLPLVFLERSHTGVIHHFPSFQVKVDAWAGKYLFVYLTPELAVQSIAALQRLHQQRGICLVAVDEAHCVSGAYRPTVRLTLSRGPLRSVV